MKKTAKFIFVLPLWLICAAVWIAAGRSRSRLGPLNPSGFKLTSDGDFVCVALWACIVGIILGVLVATR